jgi:hypothetical protein
MQSCISNRSFLRSVFRFKNKGRRPVLIERRHPKQEARPRGAKSKPAWNSRVKHFARSSPIFSICYMHTNSYNRADLAFNTLKLQQNGPKQNKFRFGGKEGNCRG